MSLNRVTIIGRLGGDPEIKILESGTLATFSVAVGEKWKDKSGQLQERTEWIRVVTFGKQAETVGEFLKKGREVYVEGKFVTRTWETDAGEKRYSTEVKAGYVQFLGSKGESQGDGPPKFDDSSEVPF